MLGLSTGCEAPEPPATNKHLSKSMLKPIFCAWTGTFPRSCRKCWSNVRRTCPTTAPTEAVVFDGLTTQTTWCASYITATNASEPNNKRCSRRVAASSSKSCRTPIP
eukprot:14383-Amphidinium_carterae.2